MQLTYDSENNTLRLTPSSDPGTPQPLSTATVNATIDIGPGGRLIGIEFPATTDELALWTSEPIAAEFVTIGTDGRAYIQITPGPIDDSLATDLVVTTEHSPTGTISAIVIPRRGVGYEISYPSGNQ